MIQNLVTKHAMEKL